MAIQTRDPDGRFAEAILAALQGEVRRIAEEEADAAADRVRERVRSQVAQFVLQAHDHFSVERSGRDLLIRVAHDGGRK